MIFVIAEQEHGALARTSWEAVAAAQRLGGAVTVVVPGADTQAAAAELSASDVEVVLRLEHPALASYTADGFVQALSALVTAESPTLVVCAHTYRHTYRTRDFVPRLAARLDRSLATDCVAVRTDTGGSPVLTRPIFQGRVHADLVLEGPPPHIITCQVGAFQADAVRKRQAPAPVRRVDAHVDPSAIRQVPESPFREARQAVDLSQAERIVAVGRGIKGQEHLAVAEELARALDAELAASRPICDAGWLPMDRQVGSSGQTVAPKLYLALGISGAIQHVVGMKGARAIVAINKDPDAPIFELADYGIQGDLFEIVPAIIAALKPS
jgi:electron transfer flavoprotein alpha subunit